MIVGIIQARMSSSRLPGKTLRPIRGVPILLMMIDRAKKSEMIDELMIATSTDKTDDVITLFCKRWSIGCFRGNLNDVLDRYYQCAMKGVYYIPDHIVRLTSDCPLIDPRIIDETINYHLNGDYDFTYNSGFPDGLDVEVMTFDTLRKGWGEAKAEDEREHVTLYFKRHSELFRIGRYENPIDLSKIKVSIDTEEDFERISRIIDICVSPDGGVCLMQ